MPLILDEEGRTVDSSGRTVQLSVQHSTAKVRCTAITRQFMGMVDVTFVTPGPPNLWIGHT